MIFIHKKDALQILADNKHKNTNLKPPVESYKKLIWTSPGTKLET